MNFVKKHYINKRLRSFIEQKKGRKVNIHTLKNANSVCFFLTYTNSERMEELVQYVFANREKKMTVICYYPNKKTSKNEKTLLFLYTVSQKNVSMTGKIKENLSDIFSQYYDIFIDLDTKTDLTSLYLKTLSNADFRIGGSLEYCNYFDFTLCANKQHTIKDYLSNLEIYTSKLSTTCETTSQK
jgi:hypothetical protein